MQLNQDFNAFMSGMGLFVSQQIDNKQEDQKEDSNSPQNAKNVRIVEPNQDDLILGEGDSDYDINEYLDDAEELSDTDPNATNYSPNRQSLIISELPNRDSNCTLDESKSPNKDRNYVESEIIEADEDSQDYFTAKNTQKTKPESSNRKSSSDNFYTVTSNFETRLESDFKKRIENVHNVESQ